MKRLFSFIVPLLLIGGGVLMVDVPAGIDLGWPNWNLFADDDVDSIDDPSDEEGGDEADDVTDCDADDSVSEYLAEVGINWMDFNYYFMGESSIDWDQLSTRNTDRAFSSPLRSEAALENFLDGASATSRAARRLIGDDYANDSGNWVAVQFNTPISYYGNHYWNGQRALEAGKQTAPAGDVWWVHVDSDCNVELSDIVRAACGNVGVDWIHPLIRED